MFKLLLSGKVDVVLTNTIDGNVAISRLGLHNVIAMNEPLARLSLHHYIHKKHQSLFPLINEEIRRMKSNGELSQLISSAEQRVIELHR